MVDTDYLRPPAWLNPPNPAVAQNPLDLASKAIGIQQQATGLSQQRTGLQKDWFGTVQDLIGSLANSGLSKDDIHQRLMVHSASHPEIPSSLYATLYNDMPGGTATGSSPLNKYLVTHVLNRMGAAGAAQPVPGPTDLATGRAGLTTAGQQLQQGSGVTPAPATPPAAPGGGGDWTPPWAVTPQRQPAGGTYKLSPSDQTSLDLAGKDYAKESATYLTDKTPMEEAIKILRKGPLDLGPGSTGRQAFRSFVTSIAGQDKANEWFGINNDKVVDMDKLAKYLEQQASNSPFYSHGGSDLRTMLQKSANPNLSQQQKSILDLMTLNLGLRRAEHAMTMGAAPYGADYTRVRASMPSHLDLRGFTADVIPRSQLAKLSPAELQKVKHSMWLAKQTGTYDF